MFQDFFNFISAWKVWHFLFHDFIVLDWILFFLCLFASAVGFFKGFGLFWKKLIHILILIFTVMLIYPTLAEWSGSHLTFAKVDFWNPFFFLVLTGLVIGAMGRFSKLQSKKGTVQFHPFWDRVVGVATGFFFALLLASFVTQFLLFLPIKKMQVVYKPGKSRFGVVMKNFVPQLMDGALAPVRAILSHKASRS